MLIKSKHKVTMKNWQRVMWGKMLWALFFPQVRRDCFQKCVSCWSRGPLGRRYSTYSLGRGSSRKGSSKWENSLRTARNKGRTGRAVTIQQRAVMRSRRDSKHFLWSNDCKCLSPKYLFSCSVLNRTWIDAFVLLSPVASRLNVFASSRNQSFQPATGSRTEEGIKGRSQNQYSLLWDQMHSEQLVSDHLWPNFNA